MENSITIDELRKKAHEINYNLFKDEYGPREIEIIGYYINRIAASYLSYHVHKELDETEKNGEISFGKKQEKYESI